MVILQQCSPTLLHSNIRQSIIRFHPSFTTAATLDVVLKNF